MTKSAVVKKNHLKFNGKNYFRVGAEDIELCSYGEKKDPVFAGNFLEVQDDLPNKKIDKIGLKEATLVEIDSSQSTKNDIFANINVGVIFKGSVNTAYEDIKNQKLKLLKLVMNLEDVKEVLNDSPKILNRLKGYGNDARIVHQVFIAEEAKLAKSFSSSNSFDISANAGIIKVTGQGGIGSSGQTSVTLSKGTTFAYLLAKLHWNKKKTQLEKLTADYWGLN